MEQKIPDIDFSVITRIVERDFPLVVFSEVEAILRNYKSESEGGRNRVYASILKLSEGNLELLTKYVEKANNDYRDVIALSEYPNYSGYAFRDLPQSEKLGLIDLDWKQYQEWLNKI
jgi:hypothetical protein